MCFCHFIGLVYIYIYIYFYLALFLFQFLVLVSWKGNILFIYLSFSSNIDIFSIISINKNVKKKVFNTFSFSHW